MARTKVVHISDTHLGKRHYGYDARGDEFAKAFEQSIDVAVDQGVDAVVHTGDLFDDPLPALPTVTRCADALDLLTEHDIPFYGIVGDHDRRDDEQWVELSRRTNALIRLGQEPTVVGDTALYGIDAVPPDDWQTTDFTLEEPPAGVDCAILCMHELLEPPGDDVSADYPIEDVLDGVDIDLDGLALGGFHQPTSARVDGTDVWYAGATERFGTDEAEAGVARLLEIDDGDITRQRLELETRPFLALTVRYGGVDGFECVHDVLARDDFTDAVAKVDLVVEDGAVTADQVTQMAHDADLAVVDDRGHLDCSVEERADVILPTAQNAVETAALRSFRRRSGRETAPAVQNAAETAPGDGTTRPDELERDDELHDGMTDEHEELVRARNSVDAELSELGAVIDDSMARLDAMDDDIAAAISDRDTATEAFLPDDRLQESVSNETRDAVASYLDTLAEKRDVRSEELAMKNATLDVETKNAADARDDIDETAAVVDRLGDWTEESELGVEAAREELDAARSRFADDLAALAEQFATFDIDLSDGTLDTVIDDRIPERKSELQASIENVRGRIAELSVEKSTLTEDYDELQSIDGGGTCPTCAQNVGSERTESELSAIEGDLDAVVRQIGAAKQERDELIARNEQLATLGVEAIAVRSFRSETVEEAAGRVEDRLENFEDLQADLEEERADLTELRGERDQADAAIATLETEVDGLEAEIDGLQADSEDGETCIEAFDVVDELRAQLEERIDELSDLQEAYEEKEAERASLDAEIEALSE